MGQMSGWGYMYVTYLLHDFATPPFFRYVDIYSLPPSSYLTCILFAVD